jgi:phosphoglycerate dehydrogenase-like enzyme
MRLGILAEDTHLQEPAVFAALKPYYELDFMPRSRYWDTAILAERCRACDVVMTGRKSPPLPQELIGHWGQLRYLCHLHGTIRPYVSKEHIDAGLIVTNWGNAVEHVAEGAMVLLLCLLKQVPRLHDYALTNQDQRVYQAYRCTPRGLRVGVYGLGPIGQHYARLMTALGAQVSFYDPYAQDYAETWHRCASLEELFSCSEAISIHCGLNDQTRHSVNRALLARLPQGGIVVNTARGGIINEAELAEQVAAGRLLAGLDVVENEADFAASPLAGLPGAIITRHIISSGKGYPPDQQPPYQLPELAVENLLAYAQKQPLKFVITTALYDLKT